MRIAITSPDILARIKQVFASRNLDVEFVRLPYIEVTVSQAASMVAAEGPGVGRALRRLDGPASRPGDTATSRRLSAEYRLNVVEVGERSKGERPAPDEPPRPVMAADGGSRVRDLRSAALSQRQREVMALVSNGVRNTEIAARLGLSEKTVKNHINRIFRSLGAANRVEAVLIWQRTRQAGSAPVAA